MSPELSRWKVERAADYLNVTRQRQVGANSRPGNALPTCAEWTEATMASHREGRHVFPRGHVRPGKEGWGSPRHQCYSPKAGAARGGGQDGESHAGSFLLSSNEKAARARKMVQHRPLGNFVSESGGVGSSRKHAETSSGEPLGLPQPRKAEGGRA